MQIQTLRFRLILFSIAPFLPLISYSQQQNNSPGSDCFADVPHTIYLSNDSVIPVSIYFHASDCIGCSNDLNFVDIQLKDATQLTFMPALTFPGSDSAAFLAMFSEYSVQNNLTGTQSFIAARPVGHSTQTILFSADTNWWIPPVPVAVIDQRYFYFTFNIPASSWQNLDTCIAIDIKVTVGIDYDTDPVFYFRVFLSHETFPALPGCYYGDTHYHGYFTDNLAENGMPLAATRRAARMVGLDWITLTDHSCDYDNFGNSMHENWENLGNEIVILNQIDSTFAFIRGLEASVNNSEGNVVHALVYPDPAHPFSLPYVCDGGGDALPTSVSLSMLLDSITTYNAFAYAAHPFSEGDVLPDLVNGGIWNMRDSLYPSNGNPCPQTGTVVWNNLSAPSDIYAETPGLLLRSGLMGGEIFNLNNYLTCDDTDNDPWNTQYNTSAGFIPVDPADVLAYRFDQNQNTYQQILYRGLLEKTQDSTLSNWKFFISGGSDAHGSFNYSSTEYVWGGVSGRVTESAVGKAFTIAYCPDSMGTHGNQVLDALKNGHTALSTGPALFMKVITPDGEYLPGDDADISSYHSDQVIFEVSAASNNDFGDVLYASFMRVTASDGNLSEISFPLMAGHCSVTLSEILGHISSPVMPVNQYICIRSRIQSFKDYSPQEALLRKTPSLLFWAETNPVWLKTGTLTENSDNTYYSLHVFPNPASGEINVYCQQPLKSPRFTLLSATGQTLPLSASGSGSQWKAIIESIPAGYYLLNMQDDNFSAQRRLVVIP